MTDSLPESARALIASGRLGHLVTLNADGSPQVAIVWVGVDGDDLVTAHLNPSQQKLKNVRRDARVAVSFEAPGRNAVGMQDNLVVHGRAEIEEGGAPELLQRLAQTYVGPGARFPPMPNPPRGCTLRIRVDRVGGQGPWTSA